ncbi:MAG: hypothetical protein E7641_08705 [Ruminococcaceae bacterium]|nr:hypothetical protein [Oscillospiraceae bacterium]
MRLISDSQFDIRQYYGNLVLLYPEGYPELTAPLRERLDVSGHVYHCCAVGASMLMKGDSFDNVIGLLDRCACLIPIMNAEVFKEENAVTRAMFWYFIGFMRARVQESIVPYIPLGEEGEEKPDLRGTPLQGIDIMYDPDTFMKKVPAKFGTKLLCYDYYENRTTNHYAVRRISFRCLSLHFVIYEKAFQNARMLYNYFNDREKNDSQFDKFIENEIVSGCRVVSFGTDTKLEPQMMVYRDEVHTYVKDYPRALVGKKNYRRMTDKQKLETGVHAEFTMDVLVPVHKLLGAYLKCYVTTTDPECPITVLLALLEPDFCNGHTSEYDPQKVGVLLKVEYWKKVYPDDLYVYEDTKKREKRMYFSLKLKTDEPLLPADPALNVGDTLDYIFPQ